MSLPHEPDDKSIQVTVMEDNEMTPNEIQWQHEFIWKHEFMWKFDSEEDF